MCQNLSTSEYHHTVLESMVDAPLFEHLSPQTTFQVCVPVAALVSRFLQPSHFIFIHSFVQVLSVDPPVFLLEDFLSEDEVLHLHALQDETMAPSGAVGASLKDSRHYRSSSTQFLNESGTPGARSTVLAACIKFFLLQARDPNAC